MGVILPGRPIANVCFKTYGYISMSQAVSFLNDFKLGHYMKIPPRSMFIVQVLPLFIVMSIDRVVHKHALFFITCLSWASLLVYPGPGVDYQTNLWWPHGLVAVSVKPGSLGE